MSKFEPKVFYNEVKEELSKVSWPTKEQTFGTSVVVFIVVLFIGVYLGAVDFVLTKLTAAIMR